jgi:hypothetical protein
MRNFCPFMSNDEKKVACDPDCNLHFREENGLKFPNGKPLIECAIPANVFYLASLQQNISACKITYTKADGTEVPVLSTLDRAVNQATSKVGQGVGIRVVVNG